MKKQLGSTDILFPIPASLIVSGSLENPNIITIAWIGIMGSSPPVIGISLKNTRYSVELIRSNNEFTVNIPSAEKYIETDYCGIVSGRVRNKFEDTNFTPLKSHKVNPPIIEECPFNMECVVIRDLNLGEWVLILGEIVETHIDDAKVDSSGRIDISKANPLVYCSTICEYWKLGGKLGNSFDAGKKILKKRED